jgi:SpoVK/Ycf46/Vps4 family AAA+-type ATPase
MALCLPISPEGLAPIEIQSALDRLRVLRSTRPAQVRKLGERLAEFSTAVWQASAQSISASEPDAARAMTNRPQATKIRLLLGLGAIIALVLTISLWPIHQGEVPSPHYWTVLCAQLSSIAMLIWLYRTWPHKGELEIFLVTPKPPLQYLLNFGGSDSQFLVLTTSGELTVQSAASFQLSNQQSKKLIAFAIHDQGALIVDLESSFTIIRERAPFGAARLGLIGQEIRRLGVSSQSIQNFEDDILLLWQLDQIIDRFQEALSRPIASAKVAPEPTQPPTTAPLRSATQPDASPLSEVIISDELRQDLVRRLDRFVSGKMTGCPGLLLYGPSGTGKTSVARALSRLGGLELISVKVADLKGDVWIGSASKNVRELWTRARAAQSKVLMFVDELDAIFPGRSSTEADVHTREIVSAFSAEWDGIEQGEAKIFILGATNRVEGIDPAIVSRFGAQKEVPLPDKIARKKILMLELARAGLGDLGLEQLTIETPSITDALFAETAGMSGRDLHKLVEELAIATDPHMAGWEQLNIVLLRWRADRSLERNEKATWDRLIVSQELKDNLHAYCRILRNYEEFRSRGVTLPRGLLLYGPSGTGKTQIARTLSNEGGLSFIGCTTSDIKQGWIGHSAQKLREIFTRARSQAPTILFIDELDVIAPVRGTYHDTITTEIVGELTQQLDGIRPDGPALFVLAASNRVDAIDPAILSRFVEQIGIGLPDELQRKQLLEVFLRGVSADNISEIAEQLALVTTDYSGRDLQQLVSRAILKAVKRSGNANTFKLKSSDFESGRSSSQ